MDAIDHDLMCCGNDASNKHKRTIGACQFSLKRRGQIGWLPQYVSKDEQQNNCRSDKPSKCAGPKTQSAPAWQIRRDRRQDNGSETGRGLNLFYLCGQCAEMGLPFPDVLLQKTISLKPGFECVVFGLLQQTQHIFSRQGIIAV